MPPRVRPLKARLVALRRSTPMSQGALARAAGIAQGYVSALEAGEKTNPSLSVLRQLAKALGVPVAALLD